MMRDEESGMPDCTPLAEGARGYNRQWTSRHTGKEGGDEQNNLRKQHTNPQKRGARTPWRRKFEEVAAKLD